MNEVANVKQTLDVVMLGIAAIMALTTIVYAVITARMLRETKKMREAQTEPHVFINIQPMEKVRVLLILVVQNIGPGPAYDLKFKVEPDLEIRKGRKLSEVNILKNGFRYLAPKQKLECIAAHSIEEANKKEHTLHEITVTYLDKDQKKYEEKFVLDFTEYFGMLYSETDPYKGIIDKINDIHSALEKVIDGGLDSKIRVVAYTKNERDEELRKYLEDDDLIPPPQDHQNK